MAPSGMLRHVALVRADVSEVLSPSIMVTRIGELGTTLSVTSNRVVFLRSVRRLLVTASVFPGSQIIVTVAGLRRVCVLPVPDLQFPIDVSGVQKDHPFLDTDSLQSLFRRLQALNRCAKMKVDNMLKNCVSASQCRACRLVYWDLGSGIWGCEEHWQHYCEAQIAYTAAVSLRWTLQNVSATTAH
jgi:hypothetical protein